ncbi:hypothetical protein H8356DRAFT_1333270 [Neocallimastix lanati (nom. inval.)]|nr:hypothetical protein H8356DRAFT_1333270 [Neocallimastix sp. JGI-2020a]
MFLSNCLLSYFIDDYIISALELILDFIGKSKLNLDYYMFKEDENPTKLSIGNISKTNDECTSISCSKCSYCKKQPNEPIDNDRNI